jgi:hypothetical protein
MNKLIENYVVYYVYELENPDYTGLSNSLYKLGLESTEIYNIIKKAI